MAPHPNIKRTWIEWEIKEGQHESVLVIETDLEIRSHAPRFDSSELDDMVQSAIEGQDAIGASFVKVRLVPLGIYRA